MRLAIIALLVGLPMQASAQTRNCKWSSNTISVYVNSASFESKGFGGTRALQQVLNAMTIWNAEGQSNLRLVYGGDTTAMVRQPGRINIWADDVAASPGACILAYAVFDTAGGVCDNAGIAVYARGWDGCQYQPIDWNHEGPVPGTFSLADVLVHELGHAAVGLSDTPAVDTVMRENAQYNATSYHLFDKDIDLLRDGFMGNFGYGARTNYNLRNYWSVNSTTWTSLSTIGQTNLKPGVAGNSSFVFVAYVDANSTTFAIEVDKSASGASWGTDTTFASSSRVGVDLEATTNAVVLAFAATGVNRDLKTRKRTATWGAEVNVGGNTRVPPGLAWNPYVSRLFLFYVDRDTHRMKWTVSADEGTTWAASAFVNVDSEREFFAVDGPAVSCNAVNECLLVWPTMGNYAGVTTSLCTSQFTWTGATISLGGRTCMATNSADTPGVAFGSSSSYTGWVMGRTGRDSNTTLVYHNKSSYNPTVDWATAYSSGLSGRSGVGLTYFPGFSEWEAFNVAP